ncbi:class I SAM-dependent DNA methyltransferase [Agrobacterium tumefaciens]|uniref:class I SAM-dependent DNA methyltransferase n=1 Tax=Agrobacterium tumefaciens TaxID=358 RepID=UPI000976F393|nr:hypothetical protein BV900_00395 [Agrobacterium tumefaciens]
MTMAHALPVDIEHAYDLAASHYDAWKWQDFWRRREAPYVLDQIRTRYTATSGSSILDLGCGTGFYLSATQEMFQCSLGIDKSREMLAVAHQRSPSSRLMHTSVDKFRSTQSFDVIIATRMISHLSDWEPVLATAQRLLKRNGLLVITGVHSAHDYVHTRLPTANGSVPTSTFKHDEREIFDCLLQRGFREPKVIEIEGDGHCGEMGASASGPVGWAAAMELG